MDNPEKQATFGTQSSRRTQTKQKQKTKKAKKKQQQNTIVCAITIYKQPK
jgi:hypothetical protein